MTYKTYLYIFIYIKVLIIIWEIFYYGHQIISAPVVTGTYSDISPTKTKC